MAQFKKEIYYIYLIIMKEFNSYLILEFRRIIMKNNVGAIKRKIFGNTKIISEYLNSDNKDSRKKELVNLFVQIHILQHKQYILALFRRVHDTSLIGHRGV